MRKILLCLCLLQFVLSPPFPPGSQSGPALPQKACLAPRLEAGGLSPDELFDRRLVQFGEMLEPVDREYLWAMTVNNANRKNAQYIFNVLATAFWLDDISDDDALEKSVRTRAMGRSGDDIRAAEKIARGVRFLRNIPGLRDMAIMREAENLRKMYSADIQSKSKKAHIRNDIAEIWDILCFSALSAAENRAARKIFGDSSAPALKSKYLDRPLAARTLTAVRRERNDRLYFYSSKSIPRLIRTYDRDYIREYSPNHGYITAEALVSCLRQNGYMLDPTDTETVSNAMLAAENISHSWFTQRYSRTLHDIYTQTREPNYPGHNLISDSHYLAYLHAAQKAGIPDSYTAKELFGAADASGLDTLTIKSPHDFFYRHCLKGLTLKGRVEIEFKGGTAHKQPYIAPWQEGVRSTFREIFFPGREDGPCVMEDVSIRIDAIFGPAIIYNFGGNSGPFVTVDDVGDARIMKVLHRGYGFTRDQLQSLSDLCRLELKCQISDLFAYESEDKLSFADTPDLDLRLPSIFYLFAAAHDMKKDAREKLLSDRGAREQVSRFFKKRDGEESMDKMLRLIAAHSRDIRLRDTMAMSGLLCNIAGRLPHGSLRPKNYRIIEKANNADIYFMHLQSDIEEIIPESPDFWEREFMNAANEPESSECLRRIARLLESSRELPLKNLNLSVRALQNRERSMTVEICA